MRTSTLIPSLVALIATAPSAFASLATLRGTIPGSLHQCESTNVFFFDSAAARPLTLVLLPTAVDPAAATITLAEVLALGPLQVIDGITTPDAQQTNFVLAVAEEQSFVVRPVAIPRSRFSPVRELTTASLLRRRTASSRTARART